jgi:hypothetical protein
MNTETRPSITDSPWYWALAFSVMGLLALAVIGFSGKYGKRQAGIERQYQGRERVAEKLAAENNPPQSERIDDRQAPRPFATPGDNLITLWPLAALLGLVAVVSTVMLLRVSRAVPGPEKPTTSS